MTAVYPGSFDPVTLGHLDIIERASSICDRLIIGVLDNGSKRSLFTPDERVEMVREVTAHLQNVEVQSFGGLTVDFARENGASVMVRGLRAVTDFEYELQMSHTNRALSPELDTVFFTTKLKYSYVSSSITKEIAMHGGDISGFVPASVAERVAEKYRGIKQ